MHLRLTVIDPAYPARVPLEVAVDAPGDTPFGQLRDHLESLTQASTFSVGGQVLLDTALLGREPLVRGATITTGDDQPSSTSSASSGLVELSVVGGYGAGRTFRLGRGDHVIGRSASADVCLDDPDVSRAHAVVSVGADEVRVRDLEPTNRTTLDDRPVPPSGAAIWPTSRVRVGSTTLSLRDARAEPARHRATEGVVHVHRPPRFIEPAPPVEILFPQPPARPVGARAPWLAALAPLLLSGGLALALSSPAMLLFALLSPVLLLGQWWSDRRAGRTSYRRALRHHRQQFEMARTQIRSAVQADARRRRSEQPDLATTAAVVEGRSPELWQRGPDDSDHLALRIGTARQPARVLLVGGSDEPVPEVDHVPVAVDLRKAGVVGLAGARGTVLSMVGAMTAQAAAWHSPRHVRLRILAATELERPDWRWVAYVPHAAGEDGGTAYVPTIGEGAFADVVKELNEQVEAHQARSVAAARPCAPTTVLILDGARELRAAPGVADLLRDGPAAGVVVVCIDQDRDALPAEATAVVDIAHSGIKARLQTSDGVLDGVIPDLPTTAWLHAFARLAGPLVDATKCAGAGTVPQVVSFRELHAEAGIDVTSCEGIVTAWSSGSGHPTALVGRGGEGPFEIDLARDGPHALVGGTTGAGKSELLRTVVAGLAVRARPDDLTFVLVDYKGGSAFGECAALPHVLGVVTDLDEPLTRRALTSLEAELRRRERLLAGAGASDFAEYAARAEVCRSQPPLARLVIVVDEFKMLADELPDFVSGLVRIATVGRSLGVHLLLATQRPAGVVSADMRANVALRIALRMRDAADSTDVIEAADAASITERTPGRALVRGGDRRLVTIQTAHVGGPHSPDGNSRSDGIRVRLVDSRRAAGDIDGQAGSHRAGSELDAVVRATQEASDRLKIMVPESPWLPALAEAIGADHLPPVEGWAIPLGVADDPSHQRQLTHTWDLDRGSLGLAGGPRSGRSTALVAIALRLAERYPVDDLHIHVLQGTPGPCAALARLAHAGAVVDGSDPPLVRRVVRRLARDLDGPRPSRRTLVLVDDWEVLEDCLATIDHGATADELCRLVRDGARLGLRFAVTGARSVLSGRLPGLLADRLLLHLPDPVDATLAGIDPAVARTARPPGRAIDVRTGLDVQLALPGSSPSAEATAAAVDAAVRRSSGAACAGPWRIEPLRDSVHMAELSGAPGMLAVGRGGDDARLVGFSPSRGQRRILIAGAPRMGTTNALILCAAPLRTSGLPVATVARQGSPLSTWAEGSGCHGVVPGDAGALADLCARFPDLCLVVDEADRLDGAPTEPVLVDSARSMVGTGGLLVVGADLSRALTSFRGLVPEVARDGNGLILGAVSPTDGDIFGIRLDTTGERRRGRGFIVSDGEVMPVQVALAGPS